MNIRYFVSAAVLLAFVHLHAQEAQIDSVYIFDNQMRRVKELHAVQTISEEDALKNTTNFSELLRFQTPIYIKENGRGMVSSPSFRGTTAGHTAFVWNGISINSQFLGQGDLNNIGILTSDQLEVKSGGGSVIYGSSAIGGSIHLNNVMEFNKGFQTLLFSEIASFETYNNLFKTSFSNDKLSVKFSGSYLISENNYEVEEQNYTNWNGRYRNTNFNLSTSYKIAPKQKISWVSEFFNGMQHYPIFTETGNRTKYGTQNFRSLLSWDLDSKKINNSLKAAYTEENFQYYGNIHNAKTTSGTGKNYILKNDFTYWFTPKFSTNLLAEYQLNKGEGYSTGIEEVKRNVGAAALLFRYFPNNHFLFEVGARKDFVEGTDSPFLFSASGKWKATKWYETALSVSRNFRYGSFNDLYWQPGGNANLLPETSIQGDFRQTFRYADFTLNVTPYYMKINDMIRWLPTSLGYWAAFNTNKVESYGLESSLHYDKTFGKHTLKSAIGYTYTKSVNLETKKQLMYVPYHKIFGTVNYGFDKVQLYVQGIFNGLTYTDSEEDRSAALDSYVVMNAGISARFFNKATVGFKVNNLFDQVYETVDYYPMPKRNYSVNLTFNF